MRDVETLRKALEPHLHVVATGRTDVPGMSVEEAGQDLILPRRASALLGAKSSDGEDRSARLYELASLLRDAGASPEATFILLQHSVWNKFQGRDDEVERLWEAVERSRVAETNEVSARRPSRTSKPGVSTSVGTLLARRVKPSEWCVEGVWQHGGIGFVAGEPKTYKSTFTTDLAVSLGSNSPFLSHFPVTKPGPVLIVQEENTEDIQHGRFSRIVRERGLGGKLHGIGRNGLEWTPPTDCSVYSMDRTGFSFGNKAKRRKVEAEVQALQPSLVVLDPLQMMMGDLSLRSEGDVAKCLNWLNYLNQTYKCGILIVHHYHKKREDGPALGGQRMLGSQILHAWLMCGLYLTRVNGPNLTCHREFRAFMDHEPFELSFDSEDGEDIYHVEVNEKVKPGRGNEVVELIRVNGRMTAVELATELGVSRRRAVQMAEALKLKRYKRKSQKQGGRPVLVYGMPREEAG